MDLFAILDNDSNCSLYFLSTVLMVSYAHFKCFPRISHRFLTNDTDRQMHLISLPYLVPTVCFQLLPSRSLENLAPCYLLSSMSLRTFHHSERYLSSISILLRIFAEIPTKQNPTYFAESKIPTEKNRGNNPLLLCGAFSVSNYCPW